MGMVGADRLDKALARLAEEATGPNIHRVAGELVLAGARQRTRSRRVAATGKVNASRGRARVTMGSPAVPFTAASHFGHGAPGRPRAQGGWMRANPFLFDSRDANEDRVVDLFAQETGDAIRRAGL